MLRAGVRTTLFAMLAGCSLLAACDKSGSDPDVSKTPSKSPKASKNAKLTDQMVAAVSTTRSATVISVYFSLDNTPAVHQALPMEIVLVPHEKLARVVGQFHGQEGITVVSGDAMEPKTDVEPESTLKHQLVLMPTAEGLFMVTASVETEGADGTVSRIFSIPLIVAPAQAAGPAAPATTPAAPPAGPAANGTQDKSQTHPAG
jgi:hypothetical protein